MTSEMQKAECRILSEVELDNASGGTSGFMYAVAHAALKGLFEGGYYIDKTVNPPVVRRND